MARALETDPIYQLEENLQCTVCLEPLKDARTLPCFHSFCKDCLEDVVKTCRDKVQPQGQPMREFPCPYCRETFTLDPDKYVADMRRNHFICNMVKATAVLNRDRGAGVPCSHNCNQSYSVARCVTCEKFLCRECLTDHNKYKGNASHSVLTMEELSKSENRNKIKDKMYCNEHQSEVLKVYCETCDQLICRDCMDFKHVKQNHSCFLVKDVANNYKELLALNNKTMEDVLTEGKDFVKRLARTTEGLDRNAQDTKSKIIQRKELIAKEFVKMLDKKAETLVNEVDQIHKNERAKLDRQTREAKQYVENVQRSVHLSKRLVEQGTEEEIISSQKMMLNSANDILKKRQEYFKAAASITKLSYSARVGAEPLNEDILRGLERSFGKVNVNNEDKDKIENKSNLNPKSPEFSGSGSRSSSAPVSYLNAVTGKTKNERENDPGPDESRSVCALCLCDFTDKKTLHKCGHSFCSGCIDEAFRHQKKCPTCSQVYGILTGNQPPGKMTVNFTNIKLSGYESYGSIAITYMFQDGVQGPEHPNPGKRYYGTTRNGFLPDNTEGRKVLKLLEKAFHQKLTFTIGRSSTSGADDAVITWNGIHHKTRRTGGATKFGYPDPNYLKRVQEELAAKGITE